MGGSDMSRYKKIGLVILIVAVLVSVIGFFVVPPVLKSILTDKLSVALSRAVTIEKINFNPWNLTLTISGVTIREKSQPKPFVSFQSLYLNVEGFVSIAKRAVVVKEITLTKPYIHIARYPDGGYNFTDLIPKEKKEEKAPESKKPFPFTVHNIQIIGGSIDFDDGPKKTTHTVRDLNFSVPFISDLDPNIDHYVEPRFFARINGTPYELKGKTKPFAASRVTTFRLDIGDIDIPYYLNYVPIKLNSKLKSALLDLKLDVHFIMAADNKPSVNLSGNVALKKIALDDVKGEKVLRLPLLSVDIAPSEPLASKIHIAKVSVQSPEVVVVRGKAGEVNLLNLITPEKKPVTGKKKEAPTEKEADKSSGSKSTMKVLVDEVRMTGADIRYNDLQPADPVRIALAPIDLTVKHLSTAKNEDATLDLSLVVNDKGKIAVNGPFKVDPFSADLTIKLSDIVIRTFQPYFTDAVKIDVTRGAVGISGRLKVDRDKQDKLRLTYNGQASVSNLATIDKAFANDFVKWKQLYFDGIKVGLNPLFITINGIALSDFYARILINSDGTANLQHIFSGSAKTGQGTEAAKPAAPVDTAKTEEKKGDDLKNIKIGRVTLQGGTIDFSDHLINPNYSVQMHDIGGSITGLSSEEISRATIDLKGDIGRGSPVEIGGRINPLVKDLYADIKMRFKDIELSQATPYAIRYLGYPIVKGKLTFDVSYLIDKRKLDAKNTIFFDQLTFGDKVDSPQAIKAPVPLAVALLTDRKGQINLDIPISGSLDDPKFKVWPIIWKILGNLITKAVTAPFTLLAHLFGGGGEEMSYVEFDYGSALLSDAGQQKINNLAKALLDRPNLKLEVAGYADPEMDKAGLKTAAFNRQIKTQKFKTELKKKGGEGLTVDAIQIQPQEYETYLTLAYKAAAFPKPRNAIGLLKDLPASEMEKLMLSHIDVTDSDIRKLAQNRAEKVKETILGAGQIDAGRVFVVMPTSVTPEKKEKAKPSRVEFKVK